MFIIMQKSWYEVIFLNSFNAFMATKINKNAVRYHKHIYMYLYK